MLTINDITEQLLWYSEYLEDKGIPLLPKEFVCDMEKATEKYVAILNDYVNSYLRKYEEILNVVITSTIDPPQYFKHKAVNKYCPHLIYRMEDPITNEVLLMDLVREHETIVLVHSRYFERVYGKDYKY